MKWVTAFQPAVAAIWGYIRKNHLACLALVLSVLSFMASSSNARMWASGEIRQLIAKEARAALEGDAEGAASLYCGDAVVRNWGTYAPHGPHPLESWQGLSAIRERYRTIPRFTRLVHTDVNVVEVNLFAGTARAVSSTDGMIATGATRESSPIAVASVNGDIWEFRRVSSSPFLPWTGEWKIASFTYDYKD